MDVMCLEDLQEDLAPLKAKEVEGVIAITIFPGMPVDGVEVGSPEDVAREVAGG